MEIKPWCDEFIVRMRNTFGNRLRFIGLQGSHGRGEAEEQSDIDMVLILDTVTVKDLNVYRQTISAMAYASLVCGFICGEKEIAAWEKSDLFHLYFDTVPLWGSLTNLVPPPSADDARRAVWKGCCDLYHTACHNLVFHRDPRILRSLYKNVFFVLRAKYFWENGSWVSRKKDLATLLIEEEAALLTFPWEDSDWNDLDGATAPFIAWASRLITEMEQKTLDKKE